VDIDQRTYSLQLELKECQQHQENLQFKITELESQLDEAAHRENELLLASQHIADKMEEGIREALHHQQDAMDRSMQSLRERHELEMEELRHDHEIAMMEKERNYNVCIYAYCIALSMYY
jgi:seryl-tRNA synthetase